MSLKWNLEDTDTISRNRSESPPERCRRLSPHLNLKSPLFMEFLTEVESLGRTYFPPMTYELPIRP